MNDKPASEVGDRRPIKTREQSWAQHVASWLAQLGLSPNSISMAGMVAGIISGCALASTSFYPEQARAGWLVGALCVQLRLLANMFDGMVAIASNQTSLEGDLYNEVPDRISDAAILAGLGYSAGGNPTLGLITAGLAIFVAYIRAQGKASGAQNEFCGPMAKPQRMFLVTVAALFCGLVPAACHTCLGQSIATWTLWIIATGCLITAVRRLHKIAHTLKEGIHHD